MLHADAHTVHARQTLATLATDNTRMTLCASVSYKLWHVLVCSAVRRDGWMSHVCLIKWEEKFATNEGRKIYEMRRCHVACATTSLFWSAVCITCIIEKINNYTSRTKFNKGTKVWILLGYPCNVLGYPSKYCNYTSNKKLGRFSHSPRPPPHLEWVVYLSHLSFYE